MPRKIRASFNTDSIIDFQELESFIAAVNHQNTDLLTVGSIAFDSIETPAGKAEGVLGGSVNYFSIAAAFYSPVQVVGVVGRDFPKAHIQWLSDRGIDVSGIEVVEGNTFHWKGQYDGAMNEAKTLSTCLNVFEHFQPKLSDKHRQAPYLFLANIDPVLQQHVLDQSNAPRLIACDSMNFWIKSKPAELLKTMKRIDVLCINEGEAYMLSGDTNITRAARKIREMGPRVLIIKRGEYGANLYTSSSIFHCPAFPVENVVDPTGAGDSFAGAFMGFLARSGIDRKLENIDPRLFDNLLRRAMVCGCVMASFTVEDFSVLRLMRLHEDELSMREQKLIDMMRL